MFPAAPVIRMRFMRFPFSWFSAQGLAALPVEEMQPARVEREAQVLVQRELRPGIDARGDHDWAGEAHGDEKPPAELLGHLDGRVESGAVLRARVADEHMLRPDAEREGPSG